MGYPEPGGEFQAGGNHIRYMRKKAGLKCPADFGTVIGTNLFLVGTLSGGWNTMGHTHPGGGHAMGHTGTASQDKSDRMTWA